MGGGENRLRAHKVHELSKVCLEKGGINLRKWRTSNPELQSLIDETENKQQPPKTEVVFTLYRTVKQSVAESVLDRASVHTINAAFEAVSAP